MNEFIDLNGVEYCPCGETSVLCESSGTQWTLNAAETHRVVLARSYRCPACKRALQRVNRSAAPATQEQSQ